MRRKLFALAFGLSLLIAAPGQAQEGESPPPIVPQNAPLVRQARILADVPAWDADWSPAGTQLAVGTLDGVLLCQCATFDSPERLIEGINAYRVKYAPDGAALAVGTAGRPAQVQLWDLTSGTQRFSVDAGADVASLAFSPDGATMAAGLSNGELLVLDTATGAEVARFEGEIGVDTLAFTPDGRSVIFPSARKMLRRQPLSGDTPVDLPTSCTFTDVNVSPDGTRLLASTYECCVEMLDLRSGDVQYRSVCGQTFTVDFNQDGSLFVTGNQDGTLHFINAADGAPISTLTAHEGPVSRVAFHPDGSRVVTVGLDDSVRVFAVASETVAGPCGTDEIPEGDPAGEILYHAQPAAGGPGRVYHVQAWCGEIQALLEGALTPAWSPDGASIAFQRVDPASGQLDGLWIAAADGSNPRRVPGTQPQDRAPAWSPDGASLLFESFRDGASGIYRVDLATGAVSAVLMNPQVAYERPAWSPDGAAIAYLVRRATSAGEVRHLYVADASGANPRRLTDLEQVSSAAWSPDGTRLVVAAARTPFTSDVLAVSVADGAIQTLTGGQLDLVPTWSPDGRYIALVRGGELVLIRADGTGERVIARLPDAAGSTGLSWKTLSTP